MNCNTCKYDPSPQESAKGVVCRYTGNHVFPYDLPNGKCSKYVKCKNNKSWEVETGYSCC